MPTCWMHCADFINNEKNSWNQTNKQPDKPRMIGLTEIMDESNLLTKGNKLGSAFDPEKETKTIKTPIT